MSKAKKTEVAEDEALQPETSDRRALSELVLSKAGLSVLGVASVAIFLGILAIASRFVEDSPGRVADAGQATNSQQGAQPARQDSGNRRKSGVGSVPLAERLNSDVPTPTTNPLRGVIQLPPPPADEPGSSPLDQAGSLVDAKFGSGSVESTSGQNDSSATGVEKASSPPTTGGKVWRPVNQPAAGRADARTRTRSYKTRAGESLFDIARHELGSAARWVEIYDLNRSALGEQLDALAGGLELQLPTTPQK